jgi:hypothetical protein
MAGPYEGFFTASKPWVERPHPVPRLRDTPLLVAAATERTGVRENSWTHPALRDRGLNSVDRSAG